METKKKKQFRKLEVKCTFISSLQLNPKKELGKGKVLNKFLKIGEIKKNTKNKMGSKIKKKRQLEMNGGNRKR